MLDEPQAEILILLTFESNKDSGMSILCILVDFTIHIDSISMGLPIAYFKWSQVDFPKL